VRVPQLLVLSLEFAEAVGFQLFDVGLAGFVFFEDHDGGGDVILIMLERQKGELGIED